MLTGLDILIARMKDHPEEFRRDGKWVDLLTSIDKHLTEEEKKALKQGFTDMARDTFNEVVLKTIANEEVHWDDVNSINIDYDTVMSYPMEKKRLMEEEHQREQARQIEMMKMEMHRRQVDMQRNQALQQRVYSSPNTSGDWADAMRYSGVLSNKTGGVW